MQSCDRAHSDRVAATLTDIIKSSVEIRAPLYEVF